MAYPCDSQCISTYLASFDPYNTSAVPCHALCCRYDLVKAAQPVGLQPHSCLSQLALSPPYHDATHRKPESSFNLGTLGNFVSRLSFPF